MIIHQKWCNILFFPNKCCLCNDLNLCKKIFLKTLMNFIIMNIFLKKITYFIATEYDIETSILFGNLVIYFYLRRKFVLEKKNDLCESVKFLY